MSENKPKIDVDKKVPDKKDVPAEELGGVAGGMPKSGPLVRTAPPHGSHTPDAES